MRARHADSLPGYRAYLEGPTKGEFAEEARRRIETLLAARHPALREADAIRLEMSLDLPEGVDLTMEILSGLLDAADIELLGPEAPRRDVPVLVVDVEATTVSLLYSSETSTSVSSFATGASMKGRFAFLAGEETLAARTFDVNKPPPPTFIVQQQVPGVGDVEFDPIGELWVLGDADVEDDAPQQLLVELVADALGVGCVRAYVLQEISGWNFSPAFKALRSTDPGLLDWMIGHVADQHPESEFLVSLIVEEGGGSDLADLFLDELESGDIEQNRKLLALEYLLEAIGWEHPETNPARSLWLAQQERAIAAAERFLNERNPDVRHAALSVLIGSEHPGAAAALVRALEHRDDLVVEGAARGLGAKRDASAVAPLAALVEQGDSSMDAAIGSLGEIGLAEAVPALMSVLEQEYAVVYMSDVRDALVRIGEPAVPVILESYDAERYQPHSEGHVLGALEQITGVDLETIEEYREWWRARGGGGRERR